MTSRTLRVQSRVLFIIWRSLWVELLVLWRASMERPCALRLRLCHHSINLWGHSFSSEKECHFVPSSSTSTFVVSRNCSSAEPAFVASCQDCVLHVLRNRWPHFQWFDFIGQHLLQRSRMHFLNQIEPKCSSGLKTIYGKPIPSDCRKIRE